jgi:hypothetical protein
MKEKIKITRGAEGHLMSPKTARKYFRCNDYDLKYVWVLHVCTDMTEKKFKPDTVIFDGEKVINFYKPYRVFKTYQEMADFATASNEIGMVNFFKRGTVYKVNKDGYINPFIDHDHFGFDEEAVVISVKREKKTRR